MSDCKSIIVTIQDYNPAIQYTVYLRPVNSQLMFATVDMLTKIATSNTVIFDNLTSGYEYEVGIQKACGGATSLIEWKYPTDPLCSSIVSITFDTTPNEFTVTLPANTVSFEWRIDKRPWVFVAANNTDVARVISFTDIAAAIGYEDGYGTVADNLYKFEARVYCSSLSKGPSKALLYLDAPATQCSIHLLENICENGIYKGQLLRVVMATKASGNDVENVTYSSPSAAPVDIATWTRVMGASPEVDIDLAAIALNGFNKQVVIDPDPDKRCASIDFISNLPPEGIAPLSTIPCGNYASYYSIT